MALLTFSNVSKMFNTDLILDHVSFQINKNEKVALIGDNGTGKTTIMKLILKEIEPTLMPKEDRVGEVSILKDTKIGYLDQNAIKNINNTVKEELEEVFIPFKKLEEELNKITEKLSKEPENEIYLKKYNEIIENDAYTSNFDYENQIKTLVSKFSFPLSILDKQINSLSGGERMKIAFIKILLSKYDFLLLDEPTNHLDISTIEWLENYLKDYNGTILFISHDRYFIEKVSNKILELEHEKITTYNTTYEGYLKEKEDRYKLLMEQYKKEEEKMAHYKKFIEFYRYKPRFVGRVKDRIKKLEKIEENHVEPPKKENKNIKINLEGGNLKNKELLEVKDLIVGYSSPLLPPISFSLYGKDKLAIIGDNGIGKTTLIKTILGEIHPLSGKILEKRKLDIGYIKQNDYSFKKGEDILSHLKNIYPLKSEKELRSALGRFLFKKEDVFKETSTLSNGEKMRVNLCALMLSSYDLLILDEPTNHLDMITKECLISGLKDYQGAIIFISHDRYFINECSDFILSLSKEKVIYFEGSYDELKLSLGKEDNDNNRNYSLKDNQKDNTKKDNELVYDPINRKEKLSKNVINELNKRMEEIERDLETIDTLLSDEFSDYKKIEELSDKKDELEKEYLEILRKLN